ncbi:MAG: VanZ family protein [Desulfobulbaceae bacterium]|nr:VanZ family protein [Desulfobulbaceae bacterium]
MTEINSSFKKGRNPHWRLLTPLIFFLFICWVIYLADSGQQSIIFDIIHNIPNGDKIGHIFIFGTLTLLLNHALGYSYIKFKQFHLQKGALLVLLFALTEEFSQLYIPNRSASIIDIISDLIGITGFTLWVLWWRQYKK